MKYYLKITIFAEICIKMRYFISKVAKIAQRSDPRQLGDLPPRSSMASGSWGLRLQTTAKSLH